jgi:hypothetical protein
MEVKMTGQIKQETEMTRQSILGKRRQRKVKGLHALSRRSLWELLLFVLISIGALSLQEFNLQESVSEPVRRLLGYPPPAYLVSIALAVYCFAALINLLTQLASDAEPLLRWSQLGYRSVFYLFYLFSGSLASHFMAVFFIGLFLYGFEQLHIWVYSSRVAHQNKELLGEQ